MSQAKIVLQSKLQDFTSHQTASTAL